MLTIARVEYDFAKSQWKVVNYHVNQVLSQVVTN